MGRGPNTNLLTALDAATAARRSHAQAADGNAVARANAAVRSAFRAIGRSGDIRRILVAERQWIVYERTHLVTSKEHADRLDRGMLEMRIALDWLDAAGGPDRCRLVGRDTPGSHDGSLDDRVRQSIRNHLAELRHYRESRPFASPGDPDHARLLAVRETNLAQADRLYAATQR